MQSLSKLRLRVAETGPCWHSMLAGTRLQLPPLLAQLGQLVPLLAQPAPQLAQVAPLLARFGPELTQQMAVRPHFAPVRAEVTQLLALRQLLQAQLGSLPAQLVASLAHALQAQLQ